MIQLLIIYLLSDRYDRSTFYTQDEVLGYLDYPFLKDQEGKATEKHYSGVTVYK